MAHFIKRRFWSRSLALRSTAAENLTHRIGFVVVELLPKIDDDLGTSTSSNTQSKICVSFRQSNCTFVATSLRSFVRLFLIPVVCDCALIPEFAAFRRLVEHALWKMPLFTRGIRANTFQMVLAWH